MQEPEGILKNLATPSVWIGIILFILSVLVHFFLQGILATFTSGAFAEAAKIFLLFAIAASLLPKRGS